MAGIRTKHPVLRTPLLRRGELEQLGTFAGGSSLRFFSYMTFCLICCLREPQAPYPVRGAIPIPHHVYVVNKIN